MIDDRLYWRISRRGLKDPNRPNNIDDMERFDATDGNYTSNYSVLVETANDGSVALRFGDGLNSAIPFGTIEVRYFSTNGEQGNRTNVVGSALALDSGDVTITKADGTESDISMSDLNVCLVTDIRGGLNIESLDSIKNNAPEVFSSLDRLVTRASYRTFLSRYSDVRYATAYGEDILNTKMLNGGINVKYMNQVRFSVLKDLYREREGKFYPTTPDEYFLEGAKVNGLMYTWEYDFQDVDRNGVAGNGPELAASIYGSLLSYVSATGMAGDRDPEEYVQDIMANAIQPILPKVKLDETVFSARMRPIDFVVPGSELHTIMLALNRRGMLTVGAGYHSYVYPSVHDMEIHMDVTLFKGNNFTDIRERIKNVIYRYLRDNTEFCTPVYRSRIEALVHQMPEVAGVDVTFVPKDNSYSQMDVSDYPWMGDRTGNYVSGGTASVDGGTFVLEGRYGGAAGTFEEEFTIRPQDAMQRMVSEYYRVYNNGKIIDNFVGYIWQCVMQEIFRAVKARWEYYSGVGQSDRAELVRNILEAIKGWDMSTGELTFADTDTVSGMREAGGGHVLYDYMNYGLNYIKLMRNILCTKSTATLIDPSTGNVTNFSNDNEIVQFTIPNETINLSVAYESSLNMEQ